MSFLGHRGIVWVVNMPNKAVAEMEHLHDSTVKDLDKLYMQTQVGRAGMPAPRAIGIDEISIRKGHDYRIIVSDLERGRPIWVGGEGRKEADLDRFFAVLGPKKSARIELAVMDMWRPFRNSVQRNIPKAGISFDKFHIMRHLGDALDEVRRSEYRRLAGEDRSYIKGNRYVLLSNRENLTLDGRRALRKLLAANKRLNTAYLLKESFGQLWNYRTERGARAFFERWQDALKWQRLEPYRKFARMIERHWHGIASYCDPNNKVSLGLVEGLNNKIREPPRLSRRLQLLRGWSHEQVSEVLTGSAGERGSDGAGTPARTRITVGSDPFDCRQDRLHGRDAAQLGAPNRA